MVLKTFNVQEDIYNRFSHFCREHGLSMSRQISFFMEYMVGKEPQARKEYLEKLERIRKGRFIPVANFSERYGLKE